MTNPSGLSVYAVSVAMLEAERPAVDHLVELAEGETERLQDARQLLHDLRTQPDRIDRADRLIQRAITRVQAGDRLIQDRPQAEARRTRDRRQLRRPLPGP